MVVILANAVYYCSLCTPHYIISISLSMGLNLSSVAEGFLDKIAMGCYSLGHLYVSATKVTVLLKSGYKQ